MQTNMPQCLYPYYVADYTPVNCGKCYHCKTKRVSGWAFRLLKQDMSSDMSFFITLTYDTEHLMFCPNNRPTLYPNHLTAFWKKLRKLLPNTKFKYYVCGEYGSNKKRPHYHAIVFTNNVQLNTFVSSVETAWYHGSIHVGTVSQASIAYTLKYISKKPSVPQYQGDTRAPEFQRVSKGLGAGYLKDSIKQWHYEDLVNRCYVPLPGNFRASMPRYFKDKIYDKIQKEQIAAHMADRVPMRTEEELQRAREHYSRKYNKTT